MSETILSPGVVTNENDSSFITQQPIGAGAAIIGPTVKGPVERPTIVTTYSEYVNKFGTSFISGSQNYTYFTSISAYNYFNNGGTTLLVTRVTSGSFTPSTSSFISGSDGTLGTIFKLETLSEGVIMNNDSIENADGSLPSGSADNIRWQIISPNTSSGTFALLIRRGDDDKISPTVLETWDNLSLDPISPNYIEKVIGNQTTTISTDGSDTYLQYSGNYQNQSRYVRVSQVNRKTPNYLNNSGDPVLAYTSSIPLAGSGSFGSAVGTNISTTEGKYYDSITNTNSQGLVASDYDQSISLLSNKDEYQFKYISTPGLVRDFASHASTVNTLITTCQERGDTMAIVDMLDYNANITEVVNEASTVNNSYAATYWPWVQTVDPNTGQQVWVPASTMVPSIYAFTDSIAEPWIAPAGINRGILSTVIKAERILTQGNRDTIYASNINPIATFPSTGVVVFGQKTLQKKKSALDRVNVRRLLIELKTTIKQIADALVFEQNTTSTRNDFLSQVNPYLSSIQQRQGLYTYRVVMDETNNTPLVIDNNQLIGAIYIQPTKTAEFIVLDFNVTQTGVSFD
tara:strand:- start:1872 stop:3590 length:1719 start_codon:yes stop_codon:yes gene_type:complete